MLQDISASIKAYGVSQGSKKTVERERLAATEACASKTYVVWSSGKDEKGVGFHYIDTKIRQMKVDKYNDGKNNRQRYCVPVNNVQLTFTSCLKNLVTDSLRGNCGLRKKVQEMQVLADFDGFPLIQYRSAWACVVCNKHGEAHETSWETELERKQDRKSVGNAFMPLAEMPQVRADVLRSTRRTLLPAVAITQIASNRASSGSRLQSKPFSGLVPRPEDSKRRRSHVRSGMSANLPNVADPRLSTSSTQQVKLPNLRVGHKGRSYSLPRSIRQAPWASSSQNRVSPMKPLHAARLPPRNSSDDGTSALASTHFPPKQLGKSRFS
eukprot:jgi/Bigna1/84781/estExt_fgenesh1_pg.C_10048